MAAFRPPAAADKRTGALRNVDRVSLALEDIGRMIPPKAVTPYSEMVVGVGRVRGLLRAGGKPWVPVPPEAGSRRREDLTRAANRLFLALGDLRMTVRVIHDRSLRTQVLASLDQVEARQWTLRDTLGLPHSLTVDEALRRR